MLIIAFDPGLVTGVSVVYVGQDELIHIGNYQFLEEELFLWLETHESSVYYRVGYESFILRRGGPFTSDQILPCYIIGALRYWSFQNNTLQPFEVTPATNKNGVSDDDLRKLGLYGPEGHDNRHQRDATRVIVNHLIEQRNMVVLRGLR